MKLVFKLFLLVLILQLSFSIQFLRRKHKHKYHSKKIKKIKQIVDISQLQSLYPIQTPQITTVQNQNQTPLATTVQNYNQTPLTTTVQTQNQTPQSTTISHVTQQSPVTTIKHEHEVNINNPVQPEQSQQDKTIQIILNKTENPQVPDNSTQSQSQDQETQTMISQLIQLLQQQKQQQQPITTSPINYYPQQQPIQNTNPMTVNNGNQNYNGFQSNQGQQATQTLVNNGFQSNQGQQATQTPVSGVQWESGMQTSQSGQYVNPNDNKRGNNDRGFNQMDVNDDNQDQIVFADPDDDKTPHLGSKINSQAIDYVNLTPNVAQKELEIKIAHKAELDYYKNGENILKVDEKVSQNYYNDITAKRTFEQFKQFLSQQGYKIGIIVSLEAQKVQNLFGDQDTFYRFQFIDDDGQDIRIRQDGIYVTMYYIKNAQGQRLNRENNCSFKTVKPPEEKELVAKLRGESFRQMRQMKLSKKQNQFYKQLNDAYDAENDKEENFQIQMQTNKLDVSKKLKKSKKQNKYNKRKN